MKPTGTVYEKGKSTTRGEFILLLPWFIRVLYRVIRSVGAGLIAFAVLIFMFSYWPIFSSEISYEIKSWEPTTKMKIQAPGTPDYSVHEAEASQILAVQEEAKSYGVTSYFSVVIPKIDAKANIVANVDTSNKKEYLDALQKGVAHAKGTNFPGQNGRIFLFSHSTDSPLNFARYNAIFYLLKKLDMGDKIIVFFSDRKYVYEVKDIKIVSPKDTLWIQPRSGEEELVLMTCDPPGTNWNRLLVFAKPVKD
jgi:LPXTG-site transpeptidase (sortase) family protein